MQEEIHGQYCHERGEKRRRQREYHPSNHPHNGAEQDKADDPSLDQLLNIPALRDVVILGVLYLSAVNRAIREFLHIAVRGSSRSKPLPHGMFLESFDPGHGPIEVSFGGSGTHNDLVDGSLVPQVEKPGQYPEKEHDIEALLSVFLPDAFQGKYHQRETSDHEPDERAAGIGEKHEPEQNQNPESHEIMVRFLGPEEVDEEANVHEDKKRRRIGSVEDPLEPLHIGPVYAMVDRRGSSEAPVREIRRKSEIEENGFMKHETHEKSSEQGIARREKEYFQVLGNCPCQERASVLGDEKCDKELEIIASAVHERGDSEPIR